MNNYIKSVSIDEIKVGKDGQGKPTGRTSGIVKIELYGYNAEWLNEPVQDQEFYIKFVLDEGFLLEYDCADVREHLEEAYDTEYSQGEYGDDMYICHREDELDMLDAEIFAAVEKFYSREVCHEAK